MYPLPLACIIDVTITITFSYNRRSKLGRTRYPQRASTLHSSSSLSWDSCYRVANYIRTPFNYLFFGILGGLKADENLEEILRFGAARSYISSVSYSMTSSWIYKSMHQFLSSSVHKKLIMEGRFSSV